MIAGLLLVIAVGPQPSPNIAQPLLTPEKNPSLALSPPSAILFFVYLGFEEVANLAEEVREPARDMPPAILWSLAITTLLYTLVACGSGRRWLRLSELAN